jgi:hypothetical protein
MRGMYTVTRISTHWPVEKLAELFVRRSRISLWNSAQLQETLGRSGTRSWRKQNIRTLHECLAQGCLLVEGHSDGQRPQRRLRSSVTEKQGSESTFGKCTLSLSG